MKTLTRILAMAMAASLLMLGSAMADTMVSINNSDDAPYYSHSVNLVGYGGILDRLYGWDNLQRVSDTDDRKWTDELIGEGAYIDSITAQAKYASYSQTMFYKVNNLDPVQLFTISSGYGTNFDNSVSGMENSSYQNTGLYLTGQPQFIFTDDNFTSDGEEWASRPSLNYDSRDHMVTFRIIGGDPNKVGNFVIAWEDLPYGGDYSGISDRDYNDLVVEVGVAPEPGTMVLLGLGLIGLATARRRFKK